MKAVIYEKYGTADVLEIREMDKPVPKTNEVLIKVYATSASAADWRLRKADPFLARLFNGLLKPKRVNVLGFELSGIIEEIASDVTSFKKGDVVFAYCGLKFGAYAEYKCMSASDLIAIKPKNTTFEEAATIPLGSLTALSLLKRVEITSGQKVLIYGSSGSVGTFAIQLAKHMGAEVTAVCSTRNTELVKSLGADHIIDYIQSNFRAVDTQFDLVFDAVGKISKADGKKIMNRNGKYVSVRSETKPTKANFLLIKELVEAGKLISVIDRCYNLEDIREAHRYVEQFRKKGNVAVRVASING